MQRPARPLPVSTSTPGARDIEPLRLPCHVRKRQARREAARIVHGPTDHSAINNALSEHPPRGSHPPMRPPARARVWLRPRGAALAFFTCKKCS
jgi:hypothetical protein